MSKNEKLIELNHKILNAKKYVVNLENTKKSYIKRHQPKLNQQFIQAFTVFAKKIKKLRLHLMLQKLVVNIFNL